MDVFSLNRGTFSKRHFSFLAQDAKKYFQGKKKEEELVDRIVVWKNVLLNGFRAMVHTSDYREGSVC